MKVVIQHIQNGYYVRAKVAGSGRPGSKYNLSYTPDRARARVFKVKRGEDIGDDLFRHIQNFNMSDHRLLLKLGFDETTHTHVLPGGLFVTAEYYAPLPHENDRAYSERIGALTREALAVAGFIGDKWCGGAVEQDAQESTTDAIDYSSEYYSDADFRKIAAVAGITCEALERYRLAHKRADWFLECLRVAASEVQYLADGGDKGRVEISSYSSATGRPEILKFGAADRAKKGGVARRCAPPPIPAREICAAGYVFARGTFRCWPV